MSTRRKVLLTILVVVFLVDVGIFWRRAHKSESQNNTDVIEKLSKEIESLNKEPDIMIAEADGDIENLRYLHKHLPPPPQEVKSSYHTAGYENSWIQDIDKETGRVLVTTMDSKMSIIFKPAPWNLDKFHVGWIAPVTFQCTKLNKKKCDFGAPYKLFVSNGLVKVEELRSLEK